MKKIISFMCTAICSTAIASQTLQLLEGETVNGQKCHIRFSTTYITSTYTAYDNSFYFYGPEDEDGSSASTYASTFESRNLKEMLHMYNAPPGTYEYNEYTGIDKNQYTISDVGNTRMIYVRPVDKEGYLDEYASYFEMSIKMKVRTIVSLNRKYYRTSFWGTVKKVFDETCHINKELKL